MAGRGTHVFPEITTDIIPYTVLLSVGICAGSQERDADTAGNSRGKACCPCRYDCGGKQAVPGFPAINRMKNTDLPEKSLWDDG